MSVYTLHHGDCLDVLRAMPDASVDSVVTDPPYGLSGGGTQSLSDRLPGIYLDVVLPDLYHANSALGRLGHFCGPLDSVAFLNFMGGAIGVEPRVAVPESPVDFESYVARQHEVKDPAESAVSSADADLRGVPDAQTVQFGSDFLLQLGTRGHTPLRNSLSGLFREYGPGCIGVPVVIPLDSEFARFLGAISPSESALLSDGVGAQNDPLSCASRTPFVVTGGGTELRAVLALDLGRGTAEFLAARSTDEFNLFFQLAGAEPIRAGTGTGGLPAKFEPRTFSLIGFPADRAFTLHFHKNLLSELNFTRKGFMGKEWDGGVPSEEIWREYLRGIAQRMRAKRDSTRPQA